MAVTRGCNGKVKIDTLGGGSPVLIAELRDWNFNEQASSIDTSKMGDCTVRKTAGAQETSGAIQCYWDPTDTAQADFVIGTQVDLEIYPGGDSSGATYYATPTGGAEILGVQRQGGGTDGVVGNEYSFTVNGKMTVTTVP